MILRVTTRGLLAAAFLAGAAPFAPSADPPASPTPAPAVENDALSVALIDAHNRERAKEKKPPLTFNARLAAAAEAHARDMAVHDKMTHEGSDGSTPAQRIERQGYHGRRIGENVAEGQESVDEVMRGWMNSPPHRENILGDFSEIGVARALSKDGTSFWCADFGLAWPKLDPSRATAAMVEAINAERKKAGKGALASDPALLSAASEEARRMAEREGAGAKPGDAPAENPLQKLLETDRRLRKLGELAASGQSSAEEAARTWLADPSTSTSLLDDEYNRVGVGFATSAKGVPCWVVILARSTR